MKSLTLTPIRTLTLTLTLTLRCLCDEISNRHPDPNPNPNPDPNLDPNPDPNPSQAGSVAFFVAGWAPYTPAPPADDDTQSVLLVRTDGLALAPRGSTIAKITPGAWKGSSPEL